MMNNKFYLTKCKKQPTNPKEVFACLWYDRTMWSNSIFGSDKISFDNWKENQIEKYEKILKQFNDTGEYLKLNNILDNSINLDEIEKQVDFVEWCK